MNPKMRTFSGVISLIVMSSFCLLQTHSYALAEVVTPELQTPSKPSKSFTVIGLVSYIDSSIIKMEKANGSDGTKNTNYTINYYSPKIENQLYEDLGIMDIAIGNKIIAQGSLVDGSIVAKRIIVFSHTSVLDELLKDNATTASSTEVVASTTTDSVGTSTEETVSSTDESGGTSTPSIDAGTSTASSTEQSGTSTTETSAGSGTDSVDNTSYDISSSAPDVVATSTEATSTEEVLTSTTTETTTPADPTSTTTVPTTDNSTNPNDKNGDAKPTTDTPDPISSGSPIISTSRDESITIPSLPPEPEPVPPTPETPPAPTPTPELISPSADSVVQI